MSFVDALQRNWYTPRARPPWYTLPAAALYGAAVTLRRSLYQHGWLGRTRLPVPVIVVGNVTLGGTGKTPLVIALAEALRGRGHRPGVVSRGHGGSNVGPRLLANDPDPAEVGDEPALIRSRTGLPVAIGADRPAAARLLARQGVDVIVADDGLQHYAMERDLEICVIDGARRFGNARLLPAGPLREPPARLHDVDFIVCNGGEPQASEIPMRLVLQNARAVADPGGTRPLAGFAGDHVHAVAGIGHPQRFFDALRAAGIDVTEHPFPDHHRYAPHDLEFGDERPVLMTEKDAVKCTRFARNNWWMVPADANLPAAFFDAVAAHLPSQAQARAAITIDGP